MRQYYRHTHIACKYEKYNNGDCRINYTRQKETETPALPHFLPDKALLRGTIDRLLGAGRTATRDWATSPPSRPRAIATPDRLSSALPAPISEYGNATGDAGCGSSTASLGPSLVTPTLGLLLTPGPPCRRDGAGVGICLCVRGSEDEPDWS